MKSLQLPARKERSAGERTSDAYRTCSTVHRLACNTGIRRDQLHQYIEATKAVFGVMNSEPDVRHRSIVTNRLAPLCAATQQVLRHPLVAREDYDGLILPACLLYENVLRDTELVVTSGDHDARFTFITALGFLYHYVMLEMHRADYTLKAQGVRRALDAMATLPAGYRAYEMMALNASMTLNAGTYVMDSAFRDCGLHEYAASGLTVDRQQVNAAGDLVCMIYTHVRAFEDLGRRTPHEVLAELNRLLLAATRSTSLDRESEENLRLLSYSTHRMFRTMAHRCYYPKALTDVVQQLMDHFNGIAAGMLVDLPTTVRSLGPHRCISIALFLSSIDVLCCIRFTLENKLRQTASLRTQTIAYMVEFCRKNILDGSIDAGVRSKPGVKHIVFACILHAAGDYILNYHTPEQNSALRTMFDYNRKG